MNIKGAGRFFQGLLRRRQSQDILATNSQARVGQGRDPQGTVGSSVLTMATQPGWTEPHCAGHNHSPLLSDPFFGIQQIGLEVDIWQQEQRFNAVIEAFEMADTSTLLTQIADVKGSNRVHSWGLLMWCKEVACLTMGPEPVRHANGQCHGN